MKTNCAAVDPAAFEAYPVGVIATDKTGTPVRHLFGPNSFDKIEEFNTLIRASACFGLDETSEAVTLEGEVKVLSKQLADLKTQVGSLGTAVSKYVGKFFFREIVPPSRSSVLPKEKNIMQKFQIRKLHSKRRPLPNSLRKTRKSN